MCDSYLLYFRFHFFAASRINQEKDNNIMLCLSWIALEYIWRVWQSKVKDVVIAEYKFVVCRGVEKYLHAPLVYCLREKSHQGSRRQPSHP